MSLDFNVTKIDNYYGLYPKTEIETWDIKGNAVKGYEWHPTTQNIVFGCMSTGIGELRKDNVAEWYARYTMWCRINGYGDDIGISYKDVVQHIGLHTNVFPEESRSKWLKSLDRKLDDIKREVQTKHYKEEVSVQSAS